MYPGFKPVSLTYLYVIRAREIKRGLLVKLTAKQAVVKGLWDFLPDSQDTLRLADPGVFETWAAAHSALCEEVAKSARGHHAAMQRDLDQLAALGGLRDPDAPEPSHSHSERRALNMGHSSNCATSYSENNVCDCEDEG